MAAVLSIRKVDLADAKAAVSAICRSVSDISAPCEGLPGRSDEQVIQQFCQRSSRRSRSLKISRSGGPSGELRSTGLAERQSGCTLDASQDACNANPVPKLQSGWPVAVCQVSHAPASEEATEMFHRAFRLCIALRRRIIRESLGRRIVNRIALRLVSTSRTACSPSLVANDRHSD